MKMSKLNLRHKSALKIYLAVLTAHAAVSLLHAFIPNLTLIKLTLTAATFTAAAILSRQWEKHADEP